MTTVLCPKECMTMQTSKQNQRADPAVKIFSFLGLSHTADVGGENGYEGSECSV